MLLSVNRVVHLSVNVELDAVTINGVAEWAFTKREQILGDLVREVIEKAQEQWLERVSEGAQELVCTGCGVIHPDGREWVYRGSRERTVKTSSGKTTFALLQITCRACGKTSAPCGEALGLAARQRVTTEMKRKAVERVYETSYRRSTRTLLACMGVSLSASTLHAYVQEAAARVALTPDPQAEIVLADGTKVRAGDRVEHEDLRLAFQLCGRSQRGERKEAHLRLLGLEVGLKTWAKVLRGCTRTRVVVTDAEAALEAHVRKHYPNARHQFCEWHAWHTLDWSLRQDGLSAKERKPLRRELASILWRKAKPQRKRALLAGYVKTLSRYPASHKQLSRAAEHMLFEEPSAERTTSLVERQMREIDRRTLVGVRWSVAGVRNLMLLSLAHRHNPDDYERSWSA